MFSNDFFYDDSFEGPTNGVEDLEQFRIFLEKATFLGFKFRTMDTFMTDNPDDPNL